MCKLAKDDDRKVQERTYGWRRSDRYDEVPVCKGPGFPGTWEANTVSAIWQEVNA